MKKRRFVCGIALCLALSVAGCGKSSEEKQAAKYYQDELGLDKKDAESLAHEVYGKDEEDPGTSVPDEGSQKSEVEPLPELVNSEWYDRKVQIYDMVFTRDEYLTEEVIRKIVEGSRYDVELSEAFDENGDVCLNGIILDGEFIGSILKNSRSSACVSAGMFEDGDYYSFGNGHIYLENNFYDKAVMEIEALDFKTRDDVLAYLAENGFVEVEEKQAPYKNAQWENELGRYVLSDTPGVEFVDMPHYYSKGAQSITFYRVHKLYENDQEVEIADRWLANRWNRYSGCHLNIYQLVYIDFNTDGTIAEMDTWVSECVILGEKIN